MSEEIAFAMATWKNFFNSRRHDITVEEIQAAYFLANQFLFAHDPELSKRFACNRCEVKDCDFRGDAYNMDTEPGIDCLAAK